MVDLDVLRTLTTCRACPRLVSHREAVSLAPPKRHAGTPYWGRPVPAFGDPAAPLWLVGLAPSAQGANRTGRMFTGDASASFLMAALHKAGLASQPTSTTRDDGLALTDVFITAAVRCVPPDNRPTGEEIRTCSPYLDAEWQLGRSERKSVVALGAVALAAVSDLLQRHGARRRPFRFAHGAAWDEGGMRVFACYHPSPQNTNTGRLTQGMILDVLSAALDHIRRPG